MLKAVWLILILSLSAHASLDVEVVEHPQLNLKSGMELLTHHLEEARFLNRTQTFAFEETNKNYSNGDVVILWGVGSSANDQTITEQEYKGLWKVMGYLAQKDFRVVMNIRSTSEDLADALSSPTASVVIFSSHGNDKYFYDFNHAAIPTDIFKYRAQNVYQFILSACHGTKALRANYVIPEDLHVISWEELTNSTELLSYLISNRWSGLEGKK